MDKSSQVCSAHFNRRCIDGKQLRGWAIPTQQLGHQEQPIYENPKNIPGFFTPTCALAHCRKRRSIDNDLRTYRYPRSEELLEKWRVNLRLAPDQCRGRICADHFEPMVRGKLKLKTGAVPTLKLGHDEGVVFDNEAIKTGLQLDGAEPELEEGEASRQLLIKIKKEKIEPDEETEHSHLDNGDNDNDDDEHEEDADDDDDHGYFDPLELVETFADDNAVDDDDDDIPGDDDQLLLPDTQPVKLENPFPPMRRDKPVNNVTPICCLKHCRKERTATHQLSTFGFPKDRLQLRKWSTNLQIPESDCVGRVCIEHFESDVLGTRKLKQHAVPTLNLGHDAPLIYKCNGQTQPLGIFDEQPQHSVFRLWSLKHCRKRKLEVMEPPDHHHHQRAVIKQEEQEDMFSCCLPHCGKRSDLHGVQLHRMPSNRILLRKWLHSLNLPQSISIDSQTRVCSEHFELQPGEPLEECIPTLKLEHSDTNIYRNQTAPISSCLVPSCPCARLNLYRGYDLPKNDLVQKAWLEFLRQPIPQSPGDGQLCVMHYMQLYEQVSLPQEVPAAVLRQLQETYEQISNSTMAMKLRCAVPGCYSKYTDNIRLTKLPTCADMFAKWLHNTKITYDPNRHYIYRICMLHFEPRCLGPVRPKLWAVPTLRLNHNNADIYRNPKLEASVGGAPAQMQDLSNQVEPQPVPVPVPVELPLRIKTELAFTGSPSASPSPRGKLRICCITSCAQQPNSLIRLFRFPTNETLLLKWLVNTQQKPRLTDPQHLFVCQDHFESDAICKKQLSSWAVPTLKLGHDGHIIPNAKHNGNIADTHENRHTLQFIWANYCSVLDCFEPRSEQLRLFAYPKDRPTIRKWAANCKHRSMQASSDGFQVSCNRFL